MKSLQPIIQLLLITVLKNEELKKVFDEKKTPQEEVSSILFVTAYN